MCPGNTQLVIFEGGTPEIVSLLGLNSEKVNLRVPFDVFKGKISNEIIKNLKHSRDVVHIVESMK